MITLLTGIPGSGKTLNLLEMVDTQEQGRDIYYHHIPGLKLPWNEISEDDVLNWESFPDGSVFVVDEVHKIWPRIPVNKDSHPSVMALDEHRHRGFDFYLVTQRPTKVDFRVRDMVGRHIHFERAFGINRSRVIEWQKSVSDPDDYHERQEALIKTKRFNKKYFPLYKSASMHTVKRRIPAKVYMVAASILVVLGLGIHLASRLTSRSDTFQEQAAVQNAPVEQGFSSPLSFSSARNETMTTEQYIASHTPRIPDIPHSAPMYDKVTEVKTFPRPQCIYAHQRETCHCFTQQATPLDISFDQCMNLVANGWFNPFLDDSNQRERAGGSQQALAAAPSPANPYYRSFEDQVTYLGTDLDTRTPDTVNRRAL